MSKVRLVLPFLLIPIFIPVYSFFDSLFFVEIFGCGCNEGFNANDLRMLFFMLLGVIAILIGLFRSFVFSKLIYKIVYNSVIIGLNIFYWNFVVTTFMWK